jgi:hypothetical protein
MEGQTLGMLQLEHKQLEQAYQQRLRRAQRDEPDADPREIWKAEFEQRHLELVGAMERFLQEREYGR